MGSGPAGSVFALSRNLGYKTRGWGRHVAKRSSDLPAAVRHRRARQSSGTGPRWDCSRVLWVAGPWGQYSGKFVLSRNCGTSRLGRHVGKRSSDPPPPQHRYATGKQGRVGIVEGSCGYRARGVSTQGKFVLSRNLGYNMRGSPRTSSSTPRRAKQNSWTGRCGDCRRVMWVPGPWG